MLSYALIVFKTKKISINDPKPTRLNPVKIPENPKLHPKPPSIIGQSLLEPFKIIGLKLKTSRRDGIARHRHIRQQELDNFKIKIMSIMPAINQWTITPEKKMGAID